MDIEAMARAMFDALHQRFNRFRDWNAHRDEDVNAEFGRNTFRHMAAAVAAKVQELEARVEEMDAPVVGPVVEVPVEPDPPPPSLVERAADAAVSAVSAAFDVVR